MVRLGRRLRSSRSADTARATTSIDLDALAILRHGEAGQQRLQRLRHVLRREAYRTSAILIDLKLDRLGLLVPVEVRIDQLAVGRHDLAHVFGNLANFQRIWSDHAELHGIANRRAEVEAVHPSAGLRQRTFGKSVFKPCLDALAGLQILGNDDDLRKVGIRQHWIEAEPEPRCALAHVARVGDDIGIAGQQAFRLFGRRIGDADRTAFRKPHLKKQLGARRGGEELLLHKTERGNRGDEHQDRHGDDSLAPAQAQLDYAAQRAIDARVVDCLSVLVRGRTLGEVRQQLQPEVGREQHRHEPGGDQRQPDDPEDAAGVFTGA